MITISRRLALKMRAVIRRALGTRRLDPAVCFTVDAGTLSVRARSADIAVEHRLPTDDAAETLWLPFEFLDDCSGKRDAPVRVEATGKGRVTAQWRDGSVPQIVQYDSAVPPDADKFPSPPETFTENPAGLLKALEDARDTTDPAPTRFAMDCVQWRGATGSIGTDSWAGNAFQFTPAGYRAASAPRKIIWQHVLPDVSPYFRTGGRPFPGPHPEPSPAVEIGFDGPTAQPTTSLDGRRQGTYP